MPSKTLIAVKNMSTVVTEAEVASALPSFQKQVSNDFCAEWGIDATLQLFGKSQKIPATAWLVGVFDDADQAGSATTI